MSRWAAPKANAAAPQRGGFLVRRWAAPKANAAARRAEVSS